MISVVVPTFDRPDGLIRAVTSVFKQTLATSGFDLIIVDNTPEGTAKDAIADLKRNCPETINLIALHEPDAGVANARNRAMTAVSTDLVAFLDDDQSAPNSWLESLLETYRQYPAAVTFGPVNTMLPEGQCRHQKYFSEFFARRPGFASGYIDASFGCGNSLIDFSKVPGHAPWFDVAMNESGGEDDVLFCRVRDAFGRFAWSETAPVWEHPPIERVSLRYTLKRAFSYGQAPITMARHGSSKRLGKIAFWMLVGLGKTFYHGLQWLALSLIRHPERAFQLDNTVRGIGKLVWWVNIGFYGVAALNKRSFKSDPQVSADFSPIVEQA